MNPLKRKIPKDTVDTIAFRLADRKYKDVRKAVSTAQRKCGTQLYSQLFKGQLSDLANAPEGWLPKVHSINWILVDGEGKSVGVRVVKTTHNHQGRAKKIHNESTLGVPLEAAMPMPYKMSQSYNNIMYNDPIITEYLDLLEQAVDLELEQTDFNTQMQNTVTAYGTWLKLYEAWPEVREVIKDLEPVEKPQLLPALGNIQELNASLGLPGEKSA